MVCSIFRAVPPLDFHSINHFINDLFSTVTGPLKEKQIAYVCRETLQVRLCGRKAVRCLCCCFGELQRDGADTVTHVFFSAAKWHLTRPDH